MENDFEIPVVASLGGAPTFECATTTLDSTPEPERTGLEDGAGHDGRPGFVLPAVAYRDGLSASH